MKTMKLVKSVMIALVGAFIMFAVIVSAAQAIQTPAPANFDKSTEVKMSDLQEVDRLKLSNVILTLNNLAKDMQITQTKFDEISKKELPELVDSIRVTYKLSKEEWDFDGNTLTFVRHKKPEPKP